MVIRGLTIQPMSQSVHTSGLYFFELQRRVIDELCGVMGCIDGG